MRAIGLAALLLGALALVYPIWDQWVPMLRLAAPDAQSLGGLLVAVGALTLAIHRQ